MESAALRTPSAEAVNFALIDSAPGATLLVHVLPVTA